MNDDNNTAFVAGVAGGMEKAAAKVRHFRVLPPDFDVLDGVRRNKMGLGAAGLLAAGGVAYAVNRALKKKSEKKQRPLRARRPR